MDKKNQFKTAASKIQQTNMIYFILLVFIAMFLISLAVAWEDYSTSLAGYQELPTRKLNIWVIYLIALIPQVGQIGFAYVFLTDSLDESVISKRWAFGIALFLFLFDSGTDVYYKAHGLPATVWIIAAFETLVVFTIGSEIMLAVSVGMLLQLIPQVYNRLGDQFSTSIIDKRRQPQYQQRNFSQGQQSQNRPQQQQQRKNNNPAQYRPNPVQMQGNHNGQQQRQDRQPEKARAIGDDPELARLMSRYTGDDDTLTR